MASAKALPPYHRNTEEIIPYVEEWLKGEDERFVKKITKIFRYAGVDRRYSIMPPEEVFTPTSFEEKNNIYIERMTDLAEEALVRAIEKAGIEPSQLDYIITTSCTGIMIPSVDAFLVNRLKLKQDIIRLPVTEMGCAGGTSALIYAHELLKFQPHKHAAIIALESPTATLQPKDLSMANLVSAAIFGDGVACTILGPDAKKALPVIRDTRMYHFYDEVRMMGFDLTNSGFKMILDPSVPDKIQSNFNQILIPFLLRNSLTLDDVDYYIFHPGGKKIVEMVENILHQKGKNIDATKEVLRSFGNMSSATVLYVLEEYLNRNITEGTGLMLSFGPGFSAQTLLLEWLT